MCESFWVAQKKPEKAFLRFSCLLSVGWEGQGTLRTV